MKKRIPIILIVCVVVFFTILWTCDTIIHAPYEYPPEQKTIEETQIPEAELAALSDRALIRTVINYPHMLAISVTGGIDYDPYRRFRDQFNGMAELEGRYLENPEQMDALLQIEGLRYYLIQATDFFAEKRTENCNDLHYSDGRKIRSYLRERAAELYK